MLKKSPLQRTQFIMMFFAFAFGMMLSSLLTHYGKQKQTDSQQKEILFIYKGIEKYPEDLVGEDRKKLAALSRQKQTIVENAALRQYFLDQAFHRNQPLEQLIQAEMPWPEVLQTEVVAFYEQNKSVLDKPLADIHPEIKNHLERQRINQAKKALLDKLRAQGDLALLPDS